MNNIVDSIKLNQALVEKWMMSQAAKDILLLYVSISKGTVTKVVKTDRGNLFDTW